MMSKPQQKTRKRFVFNLTGWKETASSSSSSSNTDENKDKTLTGEEHSRPRTSKNVDEHSGALPRKQFVFKHGDVKDQIGLSEKSSSAFKEDDREKETNSNTTETVLAAGISEISSTDVEISENSSIYRETDLLAQSQNEHLSSRNHFVDAKSGTKAQLELTNTEDRYKTGAEGGKSNQIVPPLADFSSADVKAKEPKTATSKLSAFLNQFAFIDSDEEQEVMADPELSLRETTSPIKVKQNICSDDLQLSNCSKTDINQGNDDRNKSIPVSPGICKESLIEADNFEKQEDANKPKRNSVSQDLQSNKRSAFMTAGNYLLHRVETGQDQRDAENDRLKEEERQKRLAKRQGRKRSKANVDSAPPKPKKNVKSQKHYTFAVNQKN